MADDWFLRLQDTWSADGKFQCQPAMLPHYQSLYLVGFGEGILRVRKLLLLRNENRPQPSRKLFVCVRGKIELLVLICTGTTAESAQADVTTTTESDINQGN